MIEDELRGALDLPAPPPKTQLDDVLRRGKRRVYARRAGVAFSALAVVAVVGLATTIRIPEGVENAQPPPTSSVIPNPCPNGPRTFPLAAAFGAVEVPSGFIARAQAALPDRVVGSTSTSVDYIHVRKDSLEGVVRVRAGRFTGAPEVAADDDIRTSGFCSIGTRITRTDGTVVQLFAALIDHNGLLVHRPDGQDEPDVNKPDIVQHMRVYLTNGMVLGFEQLNATMPRSGTHAAADVGGLPVNNGQTKLALDDQEMEKLGLAIAGVA